MKTDSTDNASKPAPVNGTAITPVRERKRPIRESAGETVPTAPVAVEAAEPPAKAAKKQS